MAYQGGLAGLARARDDQQRIAAGKALKRGFRIAGDISPDGFLRIGHAGIMQLPG